jgi:hypothetical protein
MAVVKYGDIIARVASAYVVRNGCAPFVQLNAHDNTVAVA